MHTSIKARELNKPRNWLIKDDVLCAIAQQQPDTFDELNHIRALDKKNRDRYGKEIVSIVLEAKDQPPEPLPPFSKKKKLSGKNLAHLTLLNAWASQRAAELNIAPAILAPQKILEKCVTGECDEALQGWRSALLSDDFQAILNGDRALLANANGLVLVPANGK